MDDLSENGQALAARRERA